MRRAALLLGLVACHPSHTPPTSIDHSTPPAASCTASIDRSTVDGALYADWEAVWRGLQTVPPEQTPADDFEAHDWLCAHTGCEGDNPWLISTGDDAERFFHLAVAVSDGILVFPNLGTGMGGRCGWEDSLEIDPLPPFHVQVVSSVDDMFDVDTDSDEIRECTPTTEQCATACFSVSHTTTDYFFDLAARKRVLAITREGKAPADETFHLTEDFTYDVELEITPDEIVVRGGGCDQTVAIATR